MTPIVTGLPRVSFSLTAPAAVRELGGLLPSPQWRHAGRTALAAIVALYLAYLLQMESPVSAAVTVVVVSQPVHGMTWSKSIYRALGTVLGALMAILLTAFFAQAPELFLLCFGLWMGACVAASTLLSNFRSYAAILSGYTVGLIVFPNMPDAPESIFTLSAARVSTVMLGIACSAVIGSLSSSRKSEREMQTRLRATLARLLDYAEDALNPGALAGQEMRRHALRGDILAIDGLMENAAAEGTGIAGLIDTHRGVVPAMLACLTGAAAVHDAITNPSDHAALPAGEDDIAGLRRDFRKNLRVLSSALRSADDIPFAAAAALASLSALKPKIEEGLFSRDFVPLRIFDRLDNLLDDLILTLRDAADLLCGRAGARRPPPAFHAEWRWAAVNGIRAAATVWLAGALWVLTAWPAGGTMLGACVTITALLTLRDRPDSDALEFFKGIALAGAAGLVCLRFVLPQISDSPLLVPLLGGVLFWGTLLAANPSRTFMGVGFQIFFLILLAPANPMRYDIGQYLNNAMALLGGALLTACVYRLVLPLSPLRHVRSLAAAIRAEIQALSTQAKPVAPRAWETRMHDRLIRLGMRLRAAGLTDDGLLHDSHAALRVGREVIRLRGFLERSDTPPKMRRAGRAAMRALGRVATDPQRAVRICHLAARHVLRGGEGGHASSAVAGRIAVSLAEIALLLGRHRRFFQFAQGMKTEG